MNQLCVKSLRSERFFERK